MSYSTHVMNAGETKFDRRFTVREAAKLLNVSEAAIRQRIQRESIAYEKDEETGRVYILLDEEQKHLDNGETELDPVYYRELIDTLQEQLRLEREASAELRRIIAGLTTRIPELPPSQSTLSDARESDLRGSEDMDGSRVPEEPETAVLRPWWRRIFKS